MTAFGRLIALFPMALAIVAGACVYWFAAAPGLEAVGALLAVLYLVPVIAFRVHQLLFPIKLGSSELAGRSYSSWWGGHQIQQIYLVFPWLEALLRQVPGLYSFWLRLWGARIGKSVYWTANVQITDRSLLDIGHNVIVGHEVGFYSHIISPSPKGLHLFVKPIAVGNGAFLGARAALGPGVTVAKGALVKTLQQVFPNQTVS